MIRTVLLLLLLATVPGVARESAAVTSSRAVATLITDTDAQDGRPFHAALRLRLAPGWHSYWQNPGDAGVAPELRFDPPAVAGPISWPAPQIVAEGSVTTYAYMGEVLLPVTITAPPGALTLRAHADWLVCERICVPETGDFSVDLAAGIATPSAEAPLFAAAAARIPVPSPYKAVIAPDGTLTLDTGAMPAGAVARAVFFPQAPGVIDAGRPQSLRTWNGGLSLLLTPAGSFDPKAGLAGLLVLTDVQGGQTYLDVAAVPGAAAADGLARLVLLALAGGLVLNLMPCVFPVLAMKAMGLARMAAGARGPVRLHAAAYTAGVVFTFVALGAALLVARAAGDAAGWGSQFQSPGFVAAMAWLLFAVGLNLSGVFAVGGGLAGAGQSLAGRGGAVGSLFTGVLAVLVATPCTAPFMAAAIAGALAAPPGATLLVFAAMGLGMALPYALLAAAPGRLARWLPRPGAWMEVLRQAMAFPMYGAAVWLVWVVSQEAGPDGVLAVGGGLLAIGFAAWAWGRAQAGPRWRLGLVAAGLSVAAAVAILPGIRLEAAAAPSGESSQAFTPDRLAALRAEGRPVFVNMTAAWCVSCLVNERLALSPASVREAFAAHHVAYLKGDWTRQDPVVSAFLRDHGREGVPLYIYYAPGRAPAVLPQILTVGTVLEAVAG